MQFDVIVGNPPYQAPEGSNAVYRSLWPKFWAKAFDLIKPGGRIALITPLTWCSPTNDLSQKDAVGSKRRLWNIFDQYTSVADVTTISDYFKGVGSTFSLVTVDTSGSEGLSFTDGFPSDLGFYPLSGGDEVREQLSQTDNLESRFRFSGKITPGIRVSVVKTRKITEENIEILTDCASNSLGIADSLTHSIYCDTREEAEQIRKRILECADVLYRHCRYNGFIDLKVLGMLRYSL
mgnify:CR=1 FL=1